LISLQNWSIAFAQHLCIIQSKGFPIDFIHWLQNSLKPTPDCKQTKDINVWKKIHKHIESTIRFEKQKFYDQKRDDNLV
jgi:hypothetical protein